jgi:hypothetical protein
MFGFHMMPLRGISSVTLSDNLVMSPNVIPFIGCAAELYTVGCEVSLKEEEKTAVRLLREKLKFKILMQCT